MAGQLLRDLVLWRFVLASLCAAVVFVEHVRFAMRALRPHEEAGETAVHPGLRIAAWVVPGLGAVLAWRQGARVAPVIFALCLVGWFALHPWA